MNHYVMLPMLLAPILLVKIHFVINLALASVTSLECFQIR